MKAKDTLMSGGATGEYTKGEWKVSKSALGEWYISTDGTLIASQVRHFNARLIAAAPDMYEALKWAYNTFDGHDDLFLPSALITQIQEALAKAEGIK